MTPLCLTPLPNRITPQTGLLISMSPYSWLLFFFFFFLWMQDTKRETWLMWAQALRKFHPFPPSSSSRRCRTEHFLSDPVRAAGVTALIYSIWSQRSLTWRVCVWGGEEAHWSPPPPPPPFFKDPLRPQQPASSFNSPSSFFAESFQPIPVHTQQSQQRRSALRPHHVRAFGPPQAAFETQLAELWELEPRLTEAAESSSVF